MHTTSVQFSSIRWVGVAAPLGSKIGFFLVTRMGALDVLFVLFLWSVQQLAWSLTSVGGFASPRGYTATTRRFRRNHPFAAVTNLFAMTKPTTAATATTFIIRGIECVPVSVHLPTVGRVTVLEATASGQELLVDLALRVDDDDDDEPLSTAATSATVWDVEAETNGLRMQPPNIGIVQQQQQQQQQEQDERQLVLSQGDPYGAVLWPAASAVADHILKNGNSMCRNKRVLEVGAGTGLLSIAAALGGATSVLATDYESIPLHLLNYAARHLNPFSSPYGTAAAGAAASTVITTAHFDLCDMETPLPVEADLFVAADVLYEPVTGKAVAMRVVQALQAGMTVVIGDSPGRAGRPSFLAELRRWNITAVDFANVTGRTVTGARHELICGKNSTSVSAQHQPPVPLTVAILELHPSKHVPIKPSDP